MDHRAHTTGFRFIHAVVGGKQIGYVAGKPRRRGSSNNVPRPEKCVPWCRGNYGFFKEIDLTMSRSMTSGRAGRFSVGYCKGLAKR